MSDFKHSSIGPGVPRRVLVTGAAGRIGSYFAEHNADRYRLRLMVMPGQDAAGIRTFGEVVEADVSDLASLKRAFEGVDDCVHLAGEPDAMSTWDRLLDTNILGTYNVFVAALAAKCRRVIFASSIHAVSGYPADVQVKPNEPVNPGDVYGVSKCFGEALGRYMAEQEGLGVVAIRIGAFQPDPNIQQDCGIKLMDSWISPRDLDQLICRSLDTPGIRFLIVHGLSDNRFKRLDISNARELLGYRPQDDSAKTNERLLSLKLPETVMAHNLRDADDQRAKSGLRNQLPPAQHS